MGDFGAIGRLAGAHKVAANNNDCVAQYLNAGGNQKGSDIDIGPPLSFTVVLTRSFVSVPRLCHLASRKHLSIFTSDTQPRHFVWQRGRCFA